MPRYDLHIRTHDELLQDVQGIDYPDFATAIVEAVRGARCLMTGEVTGGTLCLDQEIEIHDAAGQLSTTVPFTEAVRLLTAAEVSEGMATARE